MAGKGGKSGQSADSGFQQSRSIMWFKANIMLSLCLTQWEFWRRRTVAPFTCNCASLVVQTDKSKTSSHRPHVQSSHFPRKADDRRSFVGSCGMCPHYTLLLAHVVFWPLQGDQDGVLVWNSESHTGALLTYRWHVSVECTQKEKHIKYFMLRVKSWDIWA